MHVQVCKNVLYTHTHTHTHTLTFTAFLWIYLTRVDDVQKIVGRILMFFTDIPCKLSLYHILSVSNVKLKTHFTVHYNSSLRVHAAQPKLEYIIMTIASGLLRLGRNTQHFKVCRQSNKYSYLVSQSIPEPSLRCHGTPGSPVRAE